MEAALTKAQLIGGIEETIDIDTPMGIFKARSLTEGEKTRAEALLFKGLKASGGIANLGQLKIEGDAQTIYTNEADCDFYIIMCGLNIKDGDKWSIKDVAKIRFKDDTRAVLVKAISEFSNFQNAVEKANEFFRDNTGEGTSNNDS